MTEGKQEKTKEGNGTFHNHLASPQTSLSQFGFVMTDNLRPDIPLGDQPAGRDTEREF